MTGLRETTRNTNKQTIRKCVNGGQKSCPRLHIPGCRVWRAQDLIEFALIFPVLHPVPSDSPRFARVFHVLIAISNAAREGARYGVGPGMDRSDPVLFVTLDNEIKAAAVQEAGNFNLKLVTGDVTVSCPNTCIGEQNLRVVVNYTFTPIFDMLIPDSGITFVRDMEMMIP